jgi:hypothetical protein
MKKKLSPSQVRRNLKRKEDFLKKKSENSLTFQSQQKDFMCDQCGNLFKTENDLNIHMEKMHKEKEYCENIEHLDAHTELSLAQVTGLSNAGTTASNNMMEEKTSTSENDCDTIPQLDGQVEAKSRDDDEAVVFKMLDNGFAETKIIAPGVKPPARGIHPELGIGENPVKTHWHNSFWFEYVFQPSNVQMEMYQVQGKDAEDA